MLITFEGGEGSGKTTQAALLHDYLKGKGNPVLKVREPGGTEEGELMRSILTRSHNFDLQPETEVLLLNASRFQLVHTVIRPALEQGYIVICDRFFDSTLAYQGYGRGVNLDFLKIISCTLFKNIVPNRTYLLDINPSFGLSRAFQRMKDTCSLEGRFEALDLSFHKRVRHGFLEMAIQDGQRFKILDASKNQDLLFQEILADIEALL